MRWVCWYFRYAPPAAIRASDPFNQGYTPVAHTHGVVPAGSVRPGGKTSLGFPFLQLPVLHKLSISHDMPDGSVPLPGDW